MQTKILKVETTGTVAEGNLRPIIMDYMPRGVSNSLLEMNEEYAIVQIWWSKHEFAPRKADSADLAKLLENVTIIDELDTHPKKVPKRLIIDADMVEEKPGKKLKVTKSRVFPKLVGKEGSYIRKEKKQFGMELKDVYVFDEG